MAVIRRKGEEPFLVVEADPRPQAPGWVWQAVKPTLILVGGLIFTLWIVHAIDSQEAKNGFARIPTWDSR